MINWPRAIDRNRDALLRIVEVLFAMAGLGEGVGHPAAPPAQSSPAHSPPRRIRRPPPDRDRRARACCCGGAGAPQTSHHTIHHNNHHRHIRRHRPAPARSAQAVRFPPAPPPREILPAHLRDRSDRADADPRRLDPLARRRDRRHPPLPPARRAQTRAGRSRRTGQTPCPLARQTRSRVEPKQIFLADAPRPPARPPQAGLSRSR